MNPRSGGAGGGYPPTAPPRLFPVLQGMTLVAAFVIITLVSVLSSLYPVFLAIRVPPVVAMQAED